jgi:predicted DNA-binding transcriptional regulator YafY
MSRTERLLELLQVLRRQREPVSGEALARATGVSIRTLYRDIASLQAQGAAITGEAGVGYVMQPGFMLPPLMFGAEELDALVLGMRFVAAHGDRTLAQGATNALAKVMAVLPPALRREVDASALLIGAAPRPPRTRSNRTCCARPSGANASCTSITATRPAACRSASSGLMRSCISTWCAC